MSWDWWWWSSPFGSGNSDVGWVFWAILLGLLAIPIAGFIYVFFRMLITRIRWENPKYVEKHKHKFFAIEADKVTLRSGVVPMQNRRWELTNDTIVMFPDPKVDKDMEMVAVKFSRIIKIGIKETKTKTNGKYYFFRIWHKDSPSIDIPLEHRLPSFSIPFRPIALEATQEIERRFNEYQENRKKKNTK